MTIEGYRQRHRGKPVVVCGCGSSVLELDNPERFITIGVNDIGRLFDPTYLVVLNKQREFSGQRFAGSLAEGVAAATKWAVMREGER